MEATVYIIQDGDRYGFYSLKIGKAASDYASNVVSDVI